jgi:hypothetical protein
MPTHEPQWNDPQAMAIPKEGYFTREEGNYGPTFPRTPINYGFTVIAKVKPGKEETIREYGHTIESALKGAPNVLAPLKLHSLKWVLFEIEKSLYFMYQGIFDTEFDTYIDDAVKLFIETGVTTVFVNLEGFPEDWKSNVPAVIKFFREHHRPSFMEYSEYPYATTDEIKKALRTRRAFGDMLDQMQ